MLLEAGAHAGVPGTRNGSEGQSASALSVAPQRVGSMDNGDPAGAVPDAVASTVTFVSRGAWLSLSHGAHTGFIGCDVTIHPVH